MSLFITFEGIDGTGKSTQAKILLKSLATLGIPCLITREPGGSPLAEKIRELIINEEMDELTEFFLFYAARSDHIIKTIKPALDAGLVVICDRFYDSTSAYQSNLDEYLHFDAMEAVTDEGEFTPDLTFILDMDPKRAMERLDARGDKNSFDRRPLEWFETTRKEFLEIGDDPRCYIIDADRPVDEIHEEIQAIVLERIRVG